MSNEIQAITTSGLALYTVILNSVGLIWNDGLGAFETYNGLYWIDYSIPLSEVGSGIYLADMPIVTNGSYSYLVYEQAGYDPDPSDSLRGTGFLEWSGTSVLTTLSAAQVNTEVVDGLVTDVIADSIPTDGSQGSISQSIYMILQLLTEGAVSGTTWTVKKPDGTTALFTITLDNATTPTTKTRST